MIQDQWKNSRGEVVQIVDGQLQVIAANGARVPGRALNAARCDRATSRPVHNANANGVIELPFMAIPKPPVIVPDWLKAKK